MLTLGYVVSVNASGNKIVVTGASTIAPLALELGKRFEKMHPGVRIDVQSGGTSRGINDVRTGFSQIGMASRPLNNSENDLHSHVIAYDGVSIILHRDNPIKSLSNDQIRDIYTGKIANWSEVGGRDARITVVNKAEGRSTLELFLQYFSLTNSQIKAHVVIGENQQGIKTVAGNQNSIGYVSVGSAEFEQKNGTPIRLLPMNRIAATTENVGNGTFPLSRSLNLVTKDAPTGQIKQFIDFSRSSSTADLVRDQFFVPTSR